MDQRLADWVPTVDWERTAAIVTFGYPCAELSALAGRCPLIAYLPPDEVAPGVIVPHTEQALRQVVSQVCSPVKEIHVLGAMNGDEAEYQRLRRVVAEAEMCGRMHQNALLKFNVEDIERGIAYVPKMASHPPVSLLSGSAMGATGVVVGAGPSLSRNVSVLAEIQDQVIIAATNTAVPALEAAGVTPDLICCADAHPKAYEAASKTDSWRSATRVVHPHAHEMAWENADSLHWVLCKGGTFVQWVESVTGEAPLDSGGSVSTIAYSVLKLMGCSQIVLVGQDCALAHDGTLYDPATGRDHKMSIQGEHIVDFNGDVHYTMTFDAWGGIGKATSTEQLAVYAWWFQDQAQIDGDEIDLVNATEGGAHLEGWADVRLEDVEVSSGHYDNSGWLDSDKTPVETWIKAIDYQISGLKPTARSAASHIDSARQWLKTWKHTSEVQAQPRSKLISGYSVGGWDEVGKLPHPSVIGLTIDAFSRQIQRCDKLGHLLKEARKALEAQSGGD